MSDNLIFDTDIQHKVWDVEQEILDVVVDVCDKNNLKYSLAYGTLIGAVRHKGFIPWDDDIDIMMPREDYEKLRKIWNGVAPKGYILQDHYTDLDYPNNFIKIRKDNTTFIQNEEEKSKKFHKGIFIDIFPADRHPNLKISNMFQYVWFAIYSLFLRGYRSGSGGLIGFIEKVLLKIPRKTQIKICNSSEKHMCKWVNNKKGQYFISSRIQNFNKCYPHDMFNETIKTKFNNKDYNILKKYDEVLRVFYGDYMQLPPEKERVWSHHPILIDFEYNFEDLIEDK